MRIGDIVNWTYWVLGPIAGAVALIAVLVFVTWLKRQDAGNELMQKISRMVQEGAIAFLSREYKTLSVFIVVVTAVLGSVVATMSGNRP